MVRLFALKSVRRRASIQAFPPLTTLKCEGKRQFRSQVARDLACLLDVNSAVTSWTCMPPHLETVGCGHIADFSIITANGASSLLDAPDRAGLVDVEALTDAAAAIGWKYRLVDSQELYDGHRLRNVKDLLRYANHDVPLGDRLTVLATLSDNGTLTFSECLQLFKECKPIAGLASLILRENMLEIDLDETLIGPETTVRRIQR